MSTLIYVRRGLELRVFGVIRGVVVRVVESIIVLVLIMLSRVEGVLAHAEIVINSVLGTKGMRSISSLFVLLIASLALVLSILLGVRRSTAASNAHEVTLLMTD